MRFLRSSIVNQRSGRYLARSIEPQFQSLEVAPWPAALPRSTVTNTPPTGTKIFAGRRAPPGEKMQRRSASAAVLEIAVPAARNRRARRIGPAFAGSISVGADEPVRVARQIYGR